MRKLSDSFKKERGWFYIGKELYYWKNCDYCNREYRGQGKYYCSYSCNRSANPIKMFGEDNPIVKNPETRLKLSRIMKGRKPSKQTIEVVIKAHKGFYGKDAKNGRWLEDRTLLQKGEDRRLDSAYRDWRKQIYKRDNYQCRLSDSECSGRLEAHHIYRWKKFPELRYKINNGITLCHAHHPRMRSEEKRLIPVFQELVSVSSN